MLRCGWCEAKSSGETQRKPSLASIWGIRRGFPEEMTSQLRGSSQRKDDEREIYAELQLCVKNYMVET